MRKKSLVGWGALVTATLTLASCGALPPALSNADTQIGNPDQQALFEESRRRRQKHPGMRPPRNPGMQPPENPGMQPPRNPGMQPPSSDPEAPEDLVMLPPPADSIDPRNPEPQPPTSDPEIPDGLVMLPPS
ncbi:MAG TPA: hypothetical protein DD435_15650 [Cyanobacteria bacterium UBA8530]|nr:hypothetical protein [Cyanobacteria bacterium UBA8530]